MKILIISIDLTLASYTNVFSQNSVLKGIHFSGNNVVYVEAGGAGLSHSLNYDRRFKKGEADGLGFRVGISNVIGLDLGTGAAIIPLAVNYIYRIKAQLPHAIEASAGVSPFIPKVDKETLKTEIIPTIALMYRLQPVNSGIVARVGFAPYYQLGKFWSHFGASVGYKF